jgi:hypothetical protein
MCHTCGISGSEGDVWVRGARGKMGLVGNEAVDSQHESGVGESLHPCTKDYYPE